MLDYKLTNPLYPSLSTLNPVYTPGDLLLPPLNSPPSPPPLLTPLAARNSNPPEPTKEPPAAEDVSRSHTPRDGNL